MGSTYIKFAGRNQITYDAGGVYDPVVWSLGKQLGSGDQQTDTKMLAVPAIKSIVESHETKSGLDLVKQNWVSTDIQDAVVANYQELVKQLKKSTQKGLIPQMFIGFFRNTYLLLMYACFVAILIPEFAGDIRERFNFSNYMTLINVTNQGHFADPWLSRALALLYFFLIYKAVGKFYWKRIITFKKIVITSIVCFAIPFAIFTTYTAMINVMRYDFYLENLLLGGSIGGSIYFFFWAFAKPKKWYIKPLAAVGALALILALQYVLMFLNGPIDIEAMKNGNIPYIKQVGIMLQPAYKYVFMNIFEVFWMTLLFTYFATRRRFWLNTKNKVARYNSPVLFKSMKIDSEV